MTVDKEDLLEAVVGDALRDIAAEGDEGFGFDVDGAGEIDVVEVETIGERLLYYSPHDETTSWKEGRYGTADYAGGAIARGCAVL